MTATTIAGIVCLWVLAMIFLFFGWDTIERALAKTWRFFHPPRCSKLRPTAWVEAREAELLDTPIEEWQAEAIRVMPLYVLASDGETVVEMPPIPSVVPGREAIRMAMGER